MQKCRSVHQYFSAHITGAQMQNLTRAWPGATWHAAQAVAPRAWPRDHFFLAAQPMSTSCLHCNLLHNYLQCCIAMPRVPDDCSHGSLNVPFERAAPRPLALTHSPGTPTASTPCARAAGLPSVRTRGTRGARSAAGEASDDSAYLPRSQMARSALRSQYHLHGPLQYAANAASCALARGVFAF